MLVTTHAFTTSIPTSTDYCLTVVQPEDLEDADGEFDSTAASGPIIYVIVHNFVHSKFGIVKVQGPRWTTIVAITYQFKDCFVVDTGCPGPCSTRPSYPMV